MLHDLLPNGRYLPSGNYRTSDRGYLIYEPCELGSFVDLLAQFKYSQRQ